MISSWLGNWGDDGDLLSDDGPRSPAYKETATNVWNYPKVFNNYYRKLIDYKHPEYGYAHEDTEIP